MHRKTGVLRLLATCRTFDTRCFLLGRAIKSYVNAKICESLHWRSFLVRYAFSSSRRAGSGTTGGRCPVYGWPTSHSQGNLITQKMRTATPFFTHAEMCSRHVPGKNVQHWKSERTSTHRSPTQCAKGTLRALEWCFHEAMYAPWQCVHAQLHSAHHLTLCAFG